MKSGICKGQTFLNPSKSEKAHCDSMRNQRNECCSSFTPQIICSALIKELWSTSVQLVRQKRKIQTSIAPYSAFFILRANRQVFDGYLNPANKLQNLHQDWEPRNIPLDNLVPVSTQIGQKSLTIQQEKCENFQQVTRNISIRSLTKSIQSELPQGKRKIKPPSLLRLKQVQTPNSILDIPDPYLDSLRKAKIQAQHKTPAVPAKKNIIRNIIKNQERVFFDFSGKSHHLKNISKADFLARTVKVSENNEIKSIKKVFQNTPVEVGSRGVKEAHKKVISKASQIELSHISSLGTSLEVSEGVKFTHNKTILNKTKTKNPGKQLKKSISERKISKKDYENWKEQLSSFKVLADHTSKNSLDKSQSTLHQPKRTSDPARQQKKQVNLDKGSKHSMMAYKSERLLKTQKSEDILSVENEELMQVLINGPKITPQIGLKDGPYKNSKQALSYSQTLNGSSTKCFTSVKNQTSEKLDLPKITYRAEGTNKIAISKLKNSNFMECKKKLKAMARDQQISEIRKNVQSRLKI